MSLRQWFAIAGCSLGVLAGTARAEKPCNCAADRQVIDLNVALAPEPDPVFSQVRSPRRAVVRRDSEIEQAGYERPWSDNSSGSRWSENRRWNESRWNDDQWDDDRWDSDRGNGHWSDNRWKSERWNNDDWDGERWSADGWNGGYSSDYRRNNARWNDNRWYGERWTEDRVTDSRWNDDRWRNDRWADNRDSDGRWSDSHSNEGRWTVDRWEREAPRPRYSRTARSRDYVQVHSDYPIDLDIDTEAPVPDANYLDAPRYEAPRPEARRYSSRRDWHDFPRYDSSWRTASRSTRYDDRCYDSPYRHEHFWDCDDEAYSETPSAALVWQTMSSRRY
jgi:hypothetical protein